jgi:hypothetical protein
MFGPRTKDCTLMVEPGYGDQAHHQIWPITRVISLMAREMVGF